MTSDQGSLTLMPTFLCLNFCNSNVFGLDKDLFSYYHEPIYSKTPIFDAHLFFNDKAIVGSTVTIGTQQKTFRKCGNEIPENDFNCSYSLSRSNSQTYSMWVGVRYRIDISMVTAVHNVNIHGRVILKRI